MIRGYLNPLGTGMSFDLLSPLSTTKVTYRYIRVGCETKKVKSVTALPYCHAYFVFILFISLLIYVCPKIILIEVMLIYDLSLLQTKHAFIYIKK